MGERVGRVRVPPRPVTTGSPGKTGVCPTEEMPGPSARRPASGRVGTRKISVAAVLSDGLEHFRQLFPGAPDESDDAHHQVNNQTAYEEHPYGCRSQLGEVAEMARHEDLQVEELRHLERPRQLVRNFSRQFSALPQRVAVQRSYSAAGPTDGALTQVWPIDLG